MVLEEALILLYLLVDDADRMVTFGGRLRQRGPEPKLSDVEVLTRAIFGEQQGRHDDAAIHRSCDGPWRPFFPALGSYPAFARPCAALSLIKQRILDLVFPASDTIHLLDGFPIPVCRACRGHRCRTFRGEAAWGYCATKKEHFYGLRGHPVIDLAGTAVAFTVTAANIDERDVPQPLRQDPGPADRRQGLHLWRVEGRGGGPRHRPPDAAPQEHAGRP